MEYINKILIISHLSASNQRDQKSLEQQEIEVVITLDRQHPATNFTAKQVVIYLAYTRFSTGRAMIYNTIQLAKPYEQQKIEVVIALDRQLQATVLHSN